MPLSNDMSFAAEYLQLPTRYQWLAAAIGDNVSFWYSSGRLDDARWSITLQDCAYFGSFEGMCLRG